jgi:dienelactone hydrolase
MSEQVVLFHSALGLRPAVRDFADRLSEAGHIVHTPDLYDGEVFDDLEHGMKKRESLGSRELAMRAHAAVADLPPNLVYAGFSMGAVAAEMLAGTRPGARAAVLMHGALSPTALGLQRWPAVPVQVHHAADDPMVDQQEVTSLGYAAWAADVTFDEHVYDGAPHLFEDHDLEPGYEDFAEGMVQRVLSFLDDLDG